MEIAFEFGEIFNKPYSAKEKYLAKIYAELQRNQVVGTPFPQKLDHFKIKDYSLDLGPSISKCVEQHQALLKLEFRSLRKYLSIKSNIEQAIIQRDWDFAATSVEILRQEFGLSLYYYQKVVQVGHYSDEGDPDSVVHGLLDSQVDVGIKFAVFCSYFRFHPLYNYGAYSRVFQNNVQQVNFSHQEIFYFLVFGDSLAPLTEEIARKSLLCGFSLPVIDRYELLVTVMSCGRASGRSFHSRWLPRLVTKTKNHASIAFPELDIENPEDLFNLHCFQLFKLFESKGSRDIFPTIKEGLYRELVRLMINVESEQGDLLFAVEALQTVAMKIPRSILSESLYHLSRYLSGYEKLDKASSEYLSNFRSLFDGDGGFWANKILFYEETRKKAYDSLAANDLAETAALLIDVYPKSSWVARVIGITDQYQTLFRQSEICRIDQFPVVVGLGLLSTDSVFTASLDAWLYFVGFDSISALESALPQSQKNALKIFILECCDLSILKEVSGIDGNRQELRVERINLLRFVLNIDPLKYAYLKGDIFELEKQNRIDGATLAVDSSRMQINKSALDDKVEALVESRLEKTPISQITADQLSAFQIAVVGTFLLDKDCGLDAALSGRIRHGNLRERLRSAFAQNGLVFVLRDGEYAPQQEWWGHKINNVELKSKLIEEIKQLSSQIYEIIDDFVLKRVQLRIGSHDWNEFSNLLTVKQSPEGLINADIITERSVEALEAQIDSVNTHRSLCQTAVSTIWRSVDEELDKVVDYLEGTVCVRLSDLLTQFFPRVESIDCQVDFSISDIVSRCRSDVKTVCAEASRWFQVPKDVSPPQMSFSEVVELVRDSVARFLGRAFEPKIIGNVDLVIKSQRFNDFYDLVNLCLVNIVDHGGEHLSETVPVIALDDTEDGIFFEVENKVDGSVVEALSKANSQIDAACDSGSSEKINTEGKSGFVKMQQILERFERGQVEMNVFERNNLFVFRAAIARSIFEKEGDS